MNLFPSEEHVGRWLEANGYEPGATLSAEEICRPRLVERPARAGLAAAHARAEPGDPGRSRADRRVLAARLGQAARDDVDVPGRPGEVDRLRAEEARGRQAVDGNGAEPLACRQSQAQPQRA